LKITVNIDCRMQRDQSINPKSAQIFSEHFTDFRENFTKNLELLKRKSIHILRKIAIDFGKISEDGQIAISVEMLKSPPPAPQNHEKNRRNSIYNRDKVTEINFFTVLRLGGCGVLKMSSCCDPYPKIHQCVGSIPCKN